MANINLIVEVDRDQVEFLKQNGYKLSIAKTVANDTGSNISVIWSGGDFFYSNEFQWSDDYQVFAAVSYTVGALVVARTEFQDIEFGQTCTMDKAGNMNPAVGEPDQSGTFTVKNEWTNPASVGVSCTLTVSGQVVANLPFYVSPDEVVVDGTINLTPIDKVAVWFQELNATGTMIDKITGPMWTVDFTGQNPKDVTISYNKAGEWQNGPLPTDEN
ncbi:hypothetical protein FRC17_011337 [Serendipita sp. 399]|nr:hypothetical protein FRC17_011337 [Serendipita sp. 399]